MDGNTFATLELWSSATVFQVQAALRRLAIDDCLEPSSSLLCLFDPVVQCTVYRSQPLSAVLGYGHENAAAAEGEMAELIHPEDLSRVADYYQRRTSLEDEGVLTLDYRMWGARGGWLWLRSQETTLIESSPQGRRLILGIVQRRDREAQDPSAPPTITQFRTALEQHFFAHQPPGPISTAVP